MTLKATEISNSFGGPEQGSTATDEAAYNHPGIVITASSGDDGYFNWDKENDGTASANAPNAPASLQHGGGRRWHLAVPGSDGHAPVRDGVERQRPR